MKKLCLSRRGKVVASVLSGALVIGGCGGAALAMASGPEDIGLGAHGPAGDGLDRYLLTMEPAVSTSLLAGAVLASAVVPPSATTGAQPPAGAESLGPGGRVVQIAGTAYYVTDLGGVAVTPGASTTVLSPVDLAQWASQNGVQLDLPTAPGTSAPPSAPVPAASPSPSATPSASPVADGPATDQQLADLSAAPGVVSAQRVVDRVLVAGDLTLAEARALPGVAEAQPSIQGELLGELTGDDPWARAWGYHLENTGNSYAGPVMPDADVDAADGWTASQGQGTVIAVIDSGYDDQHPDMQGALWTNPDPACATADTDGDGIVGDCHGWNFYKSSADLLNDTGGAHGVAVSGLAAAREGNGVGSAGIAPRAVVMPLVVGYGRSVDLNAGIRAIYYAADHGADVITTAAVVDSRSKLIEEAGLFADRLSINIELPTDIALEQLAPEKKPRDIKRSMGHLRMKIEEGRGEKGDRTKPARFAPGGQSTQMIVGADGASDDLILGRSENLYGNYQLRRVYYSAFSPIPDSSSRLPVQKPPLMREHRLYQADWLMRFYGFNREEIVSGGSADGMLDLSIDPKLAWALKNRDQFPVDVNRADREALLRVPGLGTKSVDRILATRRHRTLRLDDVARLTRSVEKLRPFVQTLDWTPGGLTDAANLRGLVAPKAEQLSLF